MAIFDCNLAIKKIKKIKYLACNFRLRSLRELFFDCDLRANFSSIAIFAQTFLRLRSSREVFDLRANFSVIEIFVRSCDLFGAQFSVAISTQTFLWTRLIRTLSLSEFFSRSDAVFFGVSLSGDAGTDAALSDAVYFGGCLRCLCRVVYVFLDCLHCLFRITLSLSDCLCAFGLFTLSRIFFLFWCSCLPWTQLFWEPSLSDAVTAVVSDAVSFGRGCSYLDAAALFRTRMILFLRTRMLFLGRFWSSSDADAFLGRGYFPRTRMLSSDADS